VELAKYAVYLGCTRTEAQQAANITLAHLTIYESKPAAKPIDDVRAWLFKVASRMAMAELRARLNHTPLDELTAEHSVDPQLGPEKYVEMRELLGAIQALPSRYRKPLALLLKHLSYVEIAAILDCSVEAAKQRVYRARQALRASIQGRAR
jgi:RNA polymerase sigma factor (sigma-70 family)